MLPKLNMDLINLSEYCINNYLSLNLIKTKVMLFSKNVSPSDVKVILNGSLLEVVDKFKFLGFHINNSVNWDDHISYICNKLTSCISILIKCQYFLPKNMLMLIFNSIGLPNVYSNADKHCLHKLSVKYMECGRAIIGKRRYHNISNNNVLNSLNWPSFNDMLF